MQRDAIQVYIICRSNNPSYPYYRGGPKAWVSSDKDAMKFADLESANNMVLNMTIGPNDMIHIEPRPCACADSASLPTPASKIVHHLTEDEFEGKITERLTKLFKDKALFQIQDCDGNVFVLADDYKSAVALFRRHVFAAGDDYLELDEVPEPDGVVRMCGPDEVWFGPA